MMPLYKVEHLYLRRQETGRVSLSQKPVFLPQITIPIKHLLGLDCKVNHQDLCETGNTLLPRALCMMHEKQNPNQP